MKVSSIATVLKGGMVLSTDEEAQNVLSGNKSVDIIPVGTSPDLENQLTDDQLGLESPIHPLGIKPLGNKLLSNETTDAREAIGVFQTLPDGMRKSTSYLLIHDMC